LPNFLRMASYMTTHFRTGLLLSLLLLLLPTLLLAQDSATPQMEYRKLQRPSDAIGALGFELFGEETDFYTGQTSFKATDISLPGNSGLPVQLSRKKSVVEEDGFAPLTKIGDWELDVPTIEGIFSTTSGWVVSGASPNNRCSQGNGQPATVLLNGETFYANEYWHGTQMSIPGAGGQDLLLSQATTQNRPTSPSRWTTKNHWLIDCLATLQSGGSGEGFVATSPDGTKYFFNKMIKRAAILNSARIKRVIGPSPTGGNISVTLYRQKIFLAITSVQDRFGNTVSYTYNTNGDLTNISSSDGRAITLVYTSGKLTSATTSDGANTRTWQYFYATDGKLSSVKQPDNTSWIYQSTGSMYTGGSNVYADPEVVFSPCYDSAEGALLTGDVFTYTITHPSGAVGAFAYTPKIRGKSHAMFCDDKEGVYLSLSKKTISGPGQATSLWTYSYSSPNFSMDLGAASPAGYFSNVYAGSPITDCQVTACAETIWTSVTQPDGSIVKHTFGNWTEKTDGQLQSVETIAGVTSLNKKTQQYYVPPTSGTVPFTARVGANPQSKVVRITSEFELPMTQQVITQEGVTFTNQVNLFDGFARPISVTRSSSLGYSKIDLSTYADNTALWVIGQLATATDGTTSVVEKENFYSPTTALLTSSKKFGLLEQTLTYFANGTLNTITDARNNTTTLSNYKRGIPQTIAYPTGQSVSGIVNNYGWLTSATDELGYVTGYAYDSMGRLASITPPSGDTVAWTATTVAFAPVASVEYGIPAGHWKQTISKGNYRKELYLDGLWRPVVSREYDNSNIAGTQRFTRMAYDTSGRKEFVSYPGTTDALTVGVHNEYDGLGRNTKVKQHSELGVLTTTTDYLTGFQTRVTNPRGFATTTSYQVFDSPDTSRPEIIVSPEGMTTTMVRNAYGNTLSVTRSGVWNSAPISSTRSYVYDTQQRLCKRIEPETGATLLDYDATGNVAWSVQGSALTSNTCDRASVLSTDKTTRTYDALNRITAVDIPGTTNDLSYTYFADGALQTLINGTTRWDYTYNKLRLPVTEQLTIDSRVKTLTHAYTTLAQESSLTYPSGLVITNAPNALGQVTQAGTFATGVGYYPNGGMSTFSYGNGIVHTMTPNSRMLPVLSKDMNGTTAILHDTYTYDANGNVASITDGTAGAGGNRTMTYDNADRLIQTNAPNLAWLSNSFSYDALDNIRVNTLGSRTYNYQYNASTQRLDQLTLPNASVARDLTYDAQGNVTTNGVQTYIFDKANRMEAVSARESYEYDGHGRRAKIMKSVGKMTSYPIYSLDGKLITEEDSRVGKTYDYIYLNGSLVAKRSAPIGSSTYTTSYQHTDSLGSPVAESDALKTVTRIERYTPYGEPTDQVYDQGPGFTGHVTDALTGLTYAQQRYYDPVIGRFLSPDSVSTDPNTGNNFSRYNYANSNPYKFTDPDGRLPDILNKILGRSMKSENHAQREMTASASQTPNKALKTVETNLVKAQSAAPDVSVDASFTAAAGPGVTATKNILGGKDSVGFLPVGGEGAAVGVTASVEVLSVDLTGGTPSPVSFNFQVEGGALVGGGININLNPAGQLSVKVNAGLVVGEVVHAGPSLDAEIK